MQGRAPGVSSSDTKSPRTVLLLVLEPCKWDYHMVPSSGHAIRRSKITAGTKDRA